MDMQNGKWLGAGADVAIRAAFSFGMCGALVGLLYLTAQNGMADPSSSSGKEPQAATVIAALDAKPTAPQIAIDASPAPETDSSSKPILASSAKVYDVIPTKRPEISVNSAGSENKVATVERFDKCLPGCETRDPMIVGSDESAMESAAHDPNDTSYTAEPVSMPILQRAGSLLDRALDAPGEAFRKGRSVITTVVNASL